MRTDPAYSAYLIALLPLCAVRADLPTSVEIADVEITDVEQCKAERPASVEASDALNDVARELSGGVESKTAIDDAGYAMANAQLLYLKRKSPMSDDDIRKVIEDRYCTAGPNREFTEFGVYRRGIEVWIVLASHIARPGVEDAAAVAARVLKLVNMAREHARRCGGRRLSAAPPLSLSQTLTDAASRHARDMAQHESFGHVGSDGSRPAKRVSEAGYRWRATGENIAAGQSDPDAVVAAWLDSPGHCANVMGPKYKEMGVAFALAPEESPAIYWALEFASPR